MGKGKRDRFKPQDIRIHQNPVSGALESTVLDAVQLAHDRVKQILDGHMLNMGAADWSRLVTMVRGTLDGMAPRTGSPQGDADAA